MKLIVFVYFFLFLSCDFNDVLGKLCGRWYKGGLFGCCASEKNGCLKVPLTSLYTCSCDICKDPDKNGKCPEGSELASASPSTVMRTIPLSTVMRTIPVNNHIETTTTSDGGEGNNGEETQIQSEDDGGANSGVGVVRGSMVVAIVAVCMAMVVGGAIDAGGIGVGALLMVMEQLGKTV